MQHNTSLRPAEMREALREHKRDARRLRQAALVLLFVDALGLVAILVWSEWTRFL